MALLVEAARVAQLAGVTLTLRDWKELRRSEKVAWLAARSLLLAPKASLELRSSAPKADPEQLSGEDRRIRNVLQDVAREMVASKGA